MSSSDIHIRRLSAGDVTIAKALFDMMAKVLGEEAEGLSDDYVERLLSNQRFWAIAAFAGKDVVGGVTAHVIPMTRAETSALFVYDLAVRPDHQRRGVGRNLIQELRAQAARQRLDDVFVLADEEDGHALDFYRALGGTPSSVTMFDFE